MYITSHSCIIFQKSPSLIMATEVAKIRHRLYLQSILSQAVFLPITHFQSIIRGLFLQVCLALTLWSTAFLEKKNLAE